MKNKTDSGNIRVAHRRLKQRIERVQRLAWRYVKPGTSLVEDLIAERREAAKRE